MRQIDITECHYILLKIAQQFDIICRKHKIPYYMLGGTMLGAIRHKGFIPWDDDMDFGVPRSYYNRLISALHNELPRQYRCHTIDHSELIQYGFIKIEDTTTVIDDLRLKMPMHHKIGINIDIFPLDKCNINDKSINNIFSLINFNTKIFVQSTENTWYKSLVKSLLHIFIPFNQKYLVKIIDEKILNLEDGNYLANFYGRWKYKEIIPLEHYGEGVEYPFNGVNFYGFSNFNSYLNRLYGNYMELPPKEKQLIHSNEIYFR